MGTQNLKDERKRRNLFLRQFIERPTEVASIVPSSDQLVRALIDVINFSEIQVAVEYGPGTGAITAKLKPLLPESAIYVAAEPNPAFRNHLTEEGFNLELIPDYAENIADIVLQRHGEVDLVVSGLPCSIIPLETLEKIFNSTQRVLRKGGKFRMFIYTHTFVMPKMHKVISMLKQKFSSVETEVVWMNMPPATVIRCIK